MTKQLQASPAKMVLATIAKPQRSSKKLNEGPVAKAPGGSIPKSSRTGKVSKAGIQSAVQVQNTLLTKLHNESSQETAKTWPKGISETSDPFDYGSLLIGEGDKRKPNGVVNIKSSSNSCSNRSSRRRRSSSSSK